VYFRRKSAAAAAQSVVFRFTSEMVSPPSRGTSACPNRRPVDEPRLWVNAPVCIQPQVEPRQNAVDCAVALPEPEPPINRLPLTVPLRQLSPLSARVQHPENAIKDRAMVLPLATATATGRQHILNQTLLSVTKFITLRHCNLLVARPSIITRYDSPNRT
jgi:hypothetical protein